MDEKMIITIITSSAVATILSPLIAFGLEVWRNKREEKGRLTKIKEGSYREIMENIDFVYQGSEIRESESKKKKFLQNYRLMFLYANDETIKELNRALGAIESTSEKDNEKMKEKKDEISRGMIAIRKNINKKTKLTKEDFKHVS